MALPKLTFVVGAETVDLGRVVRWGVILFGVTYFTIWAGIDFIADGPNPLFWYAGLFIFTGHWVSWLSLLAIVAWKGRASLVTGLFSAGYFYAWHELLWVVMMTVMHVFQHGATIGVLDYYDYLVILLVGCLALYFGAFRVLSHRKELKVLGLLLLFDALWWAAGFHVAYDGMVPGFAKQWVANPEVNLEEILGWIFPATPLYSD